MECHFTVYTNELCELISWRNIYNLKVKTNESYKLHSNHKNHPSLTKKDQFYIFELQNITHFKLKAVFIMSYKSKVKRYSYS